MCSPGNEPRSRFTGRAGEHRAAMPPHLSGCIREDLDRIKQSWSLAARIGFQSRKMALGDKSGVSEKRFYKRLIKVADERYDVHLTRVKSQKKR